MAALFAPVQYILERIGSVDEMDRHSDLCGINIILIASCLQWCAWHVLPRNVSCPEPCFFHLSVQVLSRQTNHLPSTVSTQQDKLRDHTHELEHSDKQSHCNEPHFIKSNNATHSYLKHGYAAFKCSVS